METRIIPIDLLNNVIKDENLKINIIIYFCFQKTIISREHECYQNKKNHHKRLASATKT
jgi:hypothetical protein